MKLSSDIALEMLEEFKKTEIDINWIIHSICVGNAAAKIAKELKLDVEYAKTLGYIHDIGKGVDKHVKHVFKGYSYLLSQGYDRKYATVCLTHSYLNNDIKCTGMYIKRDVPFINNFLKTHEYSIYEKIINLCDLMCTTKITTIDKRLIDIISRRGAHENTMYHIKEAYKLKEYIDSKLGYNLYELFPEIKNNL